VLGAFHHQIFWLHQFWAMAMHLVMNRAFGFPMNWDWAGMDSSVMNCPTAGFVIRLLETSTNWMLIVLVSIPVSRVLSG
jgi:hypothetical protein